MRRKIIVLAKSPRETQWVLADAMDAQMASCLHECLLMDTLEKASAVPDAELSVRPATSDDVDFLRAISPDYALCMASDDVMEQVYSQGYATVLLSADAPTLPARFMELAFDALAMDDVDVALGPCDTGGWYLLGMKHPRHEMLELAETCDWGELEERASALSLRWYVLPGWRCVRGPDDLRALKDELTKPLYAGRSAPRTRRFLRSTETASPTAR